MNKHNFIHTLWFYKSVMEKHNYDNLKKEMIISFHCLQEKKRFSSPGKIHNSTNEILIS